MRRLLLLAPVIALATAIGAAPAAVAQSPSPPVSEAKAYVYWAYWIGAGSGDWTTASQGAGSLTPGDGTSQGWRYGVGATPSLSQPPTTKPDFAETCASTPASDGTKRIAVYIDFGTDAVAPDGQAVPANSATCAQVPESANGIQVLSEVASVRSTSAGMVCGLNDYPSTGCGQELLIAQVSAAESPNSSSASNTATSTTTGLPTWMPMLLGAVVIIGLVGAAIGINRRRKDQPPNG